MQAILRLPIIQLALAFLILAAVYNGTQATIPIFQTLPISGISSASAPRSADPATLSNLYPLVATASPEQKTPSTPNDIIPVDDAFIPKSVPKEALTSKTPDYFALLNNSRTLTLQAVTNSGVIINNKFYSYNSPLTDFAYPDPSGTGKQITPMVRQTKRNNAARIDETPGTRSFQLSLLAD